MFFLHPENLLLATLGDNDKTISAKAVKWIIKVRRSREETNNIYQFPLPKLDFNAESYYKLIEIFECRKSDLMYHSKYKGVLQVTEPPLLKDCLNLNQFIETPLCLNYPNHTQSFEHAVKLST